MTWFLIALVGPFLYAMTNYIDKILLEKYFKEGGVGTLLLFSALLSGLALPFIYLGDPTIFSMELQNILILLLVGALNILVLWFYLQAMAIDEASVIIIFYQLVPVIAAILSFFILDETLSSLQLVAMGIIIFGTSIVSFDRDEAGVFTLKKKTVLYMLLAATFWATESVLFKVVALEENVWRTLFWEHVMMVLLGILIFTTVKKYRVHFQRALRLNSARILSLNVANESIYILGNSVVAFAYVMAPLALVLLAESFQSIFVFIFGAVLTLIAPQLITERLDARHITQKLFAIMITGAGTYILLHST